MNRLSFPIEVNRDPFLHYYFHSDRLFGLEPGDGEGRRGCDDIPRTRYKWGGWQYNPAYVAWWGMIHLHEGRMDAFSAAVEWLHRQADSRGNAAVWTYAFDWVEGKAVLKAPWISAISQGLAVSLLVRSWRCQGKGEDLRLARKAGEAFFLPVEEGGLLDRSCGMTFIEEYPARPFPRVLDGFCFALLALYDLELECQSETKYPELLSSCLDAVEAYLPVWDFRGLWSWYGNEGLLCNPQYHTLNRVMLFLLARISGREALSRTAEAWDPERLSPGERLWVGWVSRLTLTLRRTQYNRLRRAHYAGRA
jgi:hypothetical protein